MLDEVASSDLVAEAVTGADLAAGASAIAVAVLDVAQAHIDKLAEESQSRFGADVDDAVGLACDAAGSLLSAVDPSAVR